MNKTVILKGIINNVMSDVPYEEIMRNKHSYELFLDAFWSELFKEIDKYNKTHFLKLSTVEAVELVSKQLIKKGLL